MPGLGSSRLIIVMAMTGDGERDPSPPWVSSLSTTDPAVSAGSLWFGSSWPWPAPSLPSTSIGKLPLPTPPPPPAKPRSVSERAVPWILRPSTGAAW